MKKILVFGILLALWLTFGTSGAQAIDVGWMQEGIRIWYYGGAGTTSSSDAEQAYLLSTVNGSNVQVITHSAINHWGSPQPIETQSYSFLDQGPCWIHPQVLQTLQTGDHWMGQEITDLKRNTYTYDQFKAEFPLVPYLLLPIRALFAHESPRTIVRMAYYIPYALTGLAYFDGDTGLLLYNTTTTGFVTVFFILSEINYDVDTHQAFAEDNGPHTGFMSNTFEEQITPSLSVLQILSTVESRYGATVQMWVSTMENGYPPFFENYCYFGDVPLLTHIDHDDASNYPPDQWNPYGQYLWWWVPPGALQGATAPGALRNSTIAALQDPTINVFDVPMTRTSTNPYTFTATQQPAGRLFFSKLWFNNDGYVTQFSAKDSSIGLNIDPDQGPLFYQNNAVDGLSYYTNTMGRAVPPSTPDKIGVFYNGYWYLDSNMSWAWDGTPADTLGIFGVGLTGAVPVVGDWNGDKTTKIGVFRDGIWYLDMNRNWQWDGTPTDKMGIFGVGLTGAVPVVGDWNGDGITKIGVFINGVWYLDMNNNWQWDGELADKIAYFGAGLTGAVPVVGDWNGDGKTKIGVYQNGYWYLDVNGNGQWDGAPSDQLGIFGVGLTNAVPVTGDWNADGITEIGIYQQGYWYLDKNRSWQWEGEPTDQFGVFGVGLTGAVPVPGKW